MTDEINSTNENKNIPKKRGRKPKNHNLEESAQNIQVEEKIPKKRGRKPKNKSPEDLVEKIPKKRGRKPKEKVYSIKELPKTFYEENKNETLILHLPITLDDKDKDPVPIENDTNNLKINENNSNINNEEHFNLPTQINFLEDNITNKSSNLFDLVEEIYNEVLSDKFNYLREFWRKIMKFHKYNNDYQNNIVRLYINTWIQKETHFDAKRGVSITQILKNTFIDVGMYNVLISEIRNHLKLKTLDDKFIDQYVELEQKIMNQYKIAFGEINNIIIDEEEMFITNSFDNNDNSTGGGKAKPNISNEEKEKGYKCLIQAIKNCRLKGESLIVSDDFSDNIYQGEYMHAKEKSILSNSERIKSKYAVPMVDTLESGINQNDKNTELFNYDEIHGITINYDKLSELIGKKIKLCRTKEEIDGILREYNKLHK